MTRPPKKKVHKTSKDLRGAQELSASVKSKERAKEIKISVVWAVAITLLLLVLKGLVQETDFGKSVEEMSYDLLQHHLSSPASAKELPIIVLDISSIPMVSVPGILQPRLVTERKPLLAIVQSLVAKQPPPLAIGLDVDFSPDQYGYADPNDQNFFETSLNEGSRVPILVGVNGSLGLGPDKWLNDPKYMSLASCIVVPKAEPGQATRYMPQWVDVKYSSPAITSRCLSMGAALAKATIPAVSGWAQYLVKSTDLKCENAVSSAPAWVRYFLESPDLKCEDPVSASEFLVDYSPLDILSNSSPEIHNSADLAKIDVGKKIVLIGRTKETTDMFGVPGKGEPFPGVFLHACAANTLLSKPLYYLTELGRIFIDILFSGAIFGTVLLIRLHYAKEGREEFMEHRLPVLLSFIVALTLVFGAVELVRYFHLMWDDFLLVAVVLMGHSPIERTTIDFARWLRKLFSPAKHGSAGHSSEDQK